MPDSAETISSLSGISGSTDIILEKLTVNNVSNVAKRSVNDQVRPLLVVPPSRLPSSPMLTCLTVTTDLRCRSCAICRSSS